MLENTDYLKTLKIMYNNQRCGCSGTKRPSVTVRRPRK